MKRKTKKAMGRSMRKITEKRVMKSTKKKVQKSHLMVDYKLDAEEQELMDSIERGEWKPVDNLEEELAFAKRAAENFFRKEERVTLRLTKYDLKTLKFRAAQKGLPYQTFMASILHQYADGHLIE